MIYLSESDFVAKGSTRYCYRHPDNPDQCIKIPHEVDRGSKQNRDDARYFKTLERRNIKWCQIPRCYGWAETNAGTGLVFDFFHTPTGLPMHNISQHLKRGRITIDQLAEPLEELKHYLLGNRIITRDLNGTNIVCDVETSHGLRLYLIDGIGNADYIKIANYWPFFARRKIERHWSRLVNKLLAQNPSAANSGVLRQGGENDTDHNRANPTGKAD